MRDAFVMAVTALAATDRRVCLLTGDLGYGLFDELERVAPGRFLNVGVAEQNLIGVAAGLAQAGKRPFAYSIAPFATSRPHDQVRVDVAISGVPVTVVGVGAGLSYGTLGPTHHATEDIALMRSLPGMTVLTPGDPWEAAAATNAAAATGSPVYLRLGKNGEPHLLGAATPFRIGVARELAAGRDVTILTCGTMLGEAVAARELLAASGLSAGLTHFGTVKPLDEEAVLAAALRSQLVVSVEEHAAIGGFGSAVAETLADAGAVAPLLRLGLPDVPTHVVGSRGYLLRHLGLDASGIARTIAERLTRSTRIAA